MSKSLSELIEAINPANEFDDAVTMDRASYDRMKRVAIRLSEALEVFQEKYIELGPIDGHEYMHADVVLTELYAEIKLSSAKDIIGG